MTRLCLAFMFVFIAVFSSKSAACMEHTVDGHTAAEEFSDARVAILARAACVGDSVAIQQALSSGADPNYEGFSQVTPLLWAVNCESAIGIESLLQAGADPNRKTSGRFSPTYAASTMWNPGPLKILLKHGGDPNAYFGSNLAETALVAALDIGWDNHGWANYYQLLDAGADINAHDEVGNTIATHAVALSAYDKVEELLNRGYRYDLVDLGGHVQAAGEVAAEFREKAAARARVIKVLEGRGVRFPVPPRNQRHSETPPALGANAPRKEHGALSETGYQ